MKPNPYTYSLQRGYQTTSAGITYNQLKEEITKEFKIDWEPHFELNFRIWFFDNFFEQEATHNLEWSRLKHGVRVDEKSGYIPFERSVSIVVYLKGESCLKYLDYIELIEARRASRQALVFSSISVVLAVIAILVTIILGK